MADKKLKTGLYINELGKLVDIIGWGYDHSEYPIIGLRAISATTKSGKVKEDVNFTYDIRRNWED